MNTQTETLPEVVPVPDFAEPLNDIYEQEIERLVPLSEIYLYTSWVSADPLFLYCTPSGALGYTPDCHDSCGCLTMVRFGESCCHAWTPELTAAIRADERLPKTIEGFCARWTGMTHQERRICPTTVRRMAASYGP